MTAQIAAAPTRSSLEIRMARVDGGAPNSLGFTLSTLRDAGFTLSPARPMFMDTGCGDWVHLDVEHSGDMEQAVEQVRAALCVAGVSIGPLRRPWGTVPFKINVPCQRDDGQPDNSLIHINLSIERAGFEIECLYVERDTTPYIAGAVVTHTGDIDAACAQVEAEMGVSGIRATPAESSAFFEIRVPLHRTDDQPDNSLIRTLLAVEHAGFHAERAHVSDTVNRYVCMSVEHTAGDPDAGCAAVEAALCVTDIRDLGTI